MSGQTKTRHDLKIPTLNTSAEIRVDDSQDLSRQQMNATRLLGQQIVDSSVRNSVTAAAHNSAKANAPLLGDSTGNDDRQSNHDSLYRSNLPSLRNDTERILVQG